MLDLQILKTANTTQPILEQIATRWSPRAFSDRDVEVKKLVAILEAAQWAPSSYNEQPWRFIVARREDEKTYAKMLEVLLPGNEKWAKDAPVLMLTITSNNFKKQDRPNKHAWHDVGMASQNLAIQASHEGLAVHFMAGFDKEKAERLFQIPNDFTPVAAAAIGYYPDQVLGTPKERTRRKLTETVFSGTFGSPAEFFDEL